MPAYLVANITVTDPERYRDYIRDVPAIIARHGGTYLIRGGAITPVEGDPGLDRLAVIQFADMAAAQAFYHSADYAPLLALRQATTTSRVAFVEGYAG